MEHRPFLKWAGGKRQLLPVLLERAPRQIGTYFEPFLGGGALFFGLRSSPRHEVAQCVLNDLNVALMTTYEVVRESPDKLVRRLVTLERKYQRSTAPERESLYYEMRKRKTRSGLTTASRMIFLNKTCYNGLYRENRRGLFNVPHGRYSNPNIADTAAIVFASSLLQETELKKVDFEQSCVSAKAGDFVYFDPPFHPLSRTSNFTTYTSSDFGRNEQERLRYMADELVDRGVNVMLSNSPHPWVRKLYDDPRYVIEEIPARRAINSRGDLRGPIGELVVTNGTLLGASV